MVIVRSDLSPQLVRILTWTALFRAFSGEFLLLRVSGGDFQPLSVSVLSPDFLLRRFLQDAAPSFLSDLSEIPP